MKSSEYTENTYIHLKLIFAFAAQSSLSRVHNDNAVAVHTCGTYAVPTRTYTVPHTQTNSRNPLILYRTLSHAQDWHHDITVYYMQLHVDDAIDPLQLHKPSAMLEHRARGEGLGYSYVTFRKYHAANILSRA
jgi:hypothetical protein